MSTLVKPRSQLVSEARTPLGRGASFGGAAAAALVGAGALWRAWLRAPTGASAAAAAPTSGSSAPTSGATPAGPLIGANRPAFRGRRSASASGRLRVTSFCGATRAPPWTGRAAETCRPSASGRRCWGSPLPWRCWTGGEAAGTLASGGEAGVGPGAGAHHLGAIFSRKNKRLRAQAERMLQVAGQGMGQRPRPGVGAEASGASPSLPAPLAPGVASYVVILSDFLDDLAPLAERLALLASRGAGGALVRVLDPAERDPPWRGGALFEGAGGGGSVEDTPGREPQAGLRPPRGRARRGGQTSGGGERLEPDRARHLVLGPRALGSPPPRRRRALGPPAPLTSPSRASRL